MKKRLFVLLIVVAVLAVASLSAFAASPDRQGNARGVWCYTVTGVQPVMFEDYQGDPTKVFASATYLSEWTGTFTGSSIDYGLAVAHLIGPDAIPMLFVGTASLRGVDVHGRVGDLEMDSIGDRPTPTADWTGTWVITSGTDELENLEGHGIFWGPGWPPPEGGTEECPDNYGVIYYRGKIKFLRP